MRRKTAFTLVELLVVIAIIALLMAILLPVLGRIKMQARAVVCRSNLRQWGMWFSMYTQDNDDKFFGGLNPRTGGPSARSRWTVVMRPYFQDSNDILLCPMAVKQNSAQGFTFSAWRWGLNQYGTYRGSYALNFNVRNDPDSSQNSHQSYWKTSLVKSPDNVPVFLDCRNYRIGSVKVAGPPPAPDLPTRGLGGCDVCINRHEGGINMLFMDWSVRKVGLKELWTLKWHREWDTANEWTKAGGVKREDWPEWMRNFKDY
ncbi:MAG: type II secretion system protein [Planctomycetota bacterium]|jgi:prepilin-type N-terminal cleavage/methylation domain-containing protein/prepilin-type processing-associated H-X9-DG protein